MIIFIPPAHSDWFVKMGLKEGVDFLVYEQIKEKGKENDKKQFRLPAW